MKVIVVGAGASGMMAAITAAKQGANVMILEHMDTAGKKLLVTGNGKCNFTNMIQGVDYYRGLHPTFMLPILKQFNEKDAIDFFEEVGVFSKTKMQDYLYPYNEQASYIRKSLLRACEQLKITIVYNCGIRRIIAKKNFTIETKDKNYICDKLILATGGKSYKKTGSDGSGYLYLKDLGHSFIKPLPSLVALCCSNNICKGTSGIRINAGIKLFIDGIESDASSGELQLTDYGLSGIPTFQISSRAVRALDEKHTVSVLVDFLPEVSYECFVRFMKEQLHRSLFTYWWEVLQAYLPEKLAQALTQQVFGDGKLMIQKEHGKKIDTLVKAIKSAEYQIINSKGFDFAQVTSGGVPTDEIQSGTMESKIHKNLYFAGEMVDIDGLCGGYNLQWAWSSGFVAGKFAGKNTEKK